MKSVVFIHKFTVISLSKYKHDEQHNVFSVTLTEFHSFSLFYTVVPHMLLFPPFLPCSCTYRYFISLSRTVRVRMLSTNSATACEHYTKALHL